MSDSKRTETPTPIRVMLVDDHIVVRSGLAALLLAFDDLELVGEAGSGEEAIRLCQRIRPDVILMDLVMPNMDGATTTQVIKKQYPEVQVIALTSFKETDLVERVLDAGAIGYLLKSVSADELVDAIRAAHAGRATLSPEVVQALTQAQKLEQLGRAILDAPPDVSTLSELLGQYVPDMFPEAQIAIRVFSDRTLLHHPAGAPPVPEAAWDWLRSATQARVLAPGTLHPWDGLEQKATRLTLAPIIDPIDMAPVGGIWVSQRLAGDAAAAPLSMVQSLAAQISSALHSAQTYAETLAHQKVARELEMAGHIQASFLPAQLPAIDGWQLAARLKPARETSGDFYDILLQPDGKLGLVIADVADKGMGAALYAALTSTLIRTYAAERPAAPEFVLRATNHRILTDTRAGLFVTLFYGILDPRTGLMTYCNAGHLPPYVASQDDLRTLPRTGMALGVMEDATWVRKETRLEPGTTLLLYTDGVTEAQDARGTFFDQDRLRQVIQAHAGHPAHATQEAILDRVRTFVGDAPQFDDLTLMVVVRDR